MPRLSALDQRRDDLKEDPRQDGDDGDCHQQLDEGKSPMTENDSGEFQSSFR